MNLARFKPVFSAFFLFLYALTTVSQDVRAMRNDEVLNRGGTGEGFGIIEMGGHNFGSNSIGVWLSGTVRIALMDTISDDLSGIGIFDARLSSDELKQAKDIHNQL